LAFAIFCLSGGGEIVLVELVVLNFLFRVGLAQFFVMVDWAFDVFS
jgi:hypothetical protein